MPDFTKRFCYYIDGSQEPPGPDKPGYIPSVVFENESGHYPLVGKDSVATPWYWGNSLKDAEIICKRENGRLGLTPEDVQDIIDSSIEAQLREQGARRAAAGRYRGGRAEITEQEADDGV